MREEVKISDLGPILLGVAYESKGLGPFLIWLVFDGRGDFFISFVLFFEGQDQKFFIEHSFIFMGNFLTI